MTIVGCTLSFSPIVTLQDPTNDDYGPGTYRYPSDRLHTPGSYDLTRLAIGLRDDEVVVRVDIRGWFGANAGQDASRNNSPRGLPPNLQSEEIPNYSLQNIELYIDTDANPNTGFHESLPGRGVAIEGGWERAIWLSPAPSKARAALDRKSPELSPYVIIPTDLLAKNHTLEARFPIQELSQKPKSSWGYTAILSGAVLNDSFTGKDNFFVRPVSLVADESSFIGRGAPVIDVWVPKGAKPSQEEMLQKKNPELFARSGTGEGFAAVPEEPIAPITPNTQPASTPTPTSLKAASATAIIVDQKGGVISLSITSGEIKVGQLGELTSKPGTYLIVTEIIGELCLAKVIQRETAALFVTGQEIQF